MHNTRRRFMRLLSAFFACAMLAALLPVSVFAETAEEKIERLQRELDEINSSIATQQQNVADERQLLASLGQQEAALRDLIAANLESIAGVEALVEQKQAEIAATRQVIYENEQLLCERLVAIYKMNNGDVLSLILNVTTFSELKAVVDSIKLISQHDTELLDLLQKETERLEAEVAQLDALMAELDEKYGDLNAQVGELAQSISAQDKNVTDAEALLAAEKDTYGITYEEMLEEQRKMDELLDELNKIPSPAPLPDPGDSGGETGGETGGDADGDTGGDTGGDAGGSGGGGAPQPPASDGRFCWPVSGYYTVTCEFGEPDPWGIGHKGMDISAPSGAHILAADAGTVVSAGWNDSYGYYMQIEHANGVRTLYAHCSGFAVSAGAVVAKGQTVAYVGNTGAVYGSGGGYHLHFEVTLNGVRQNPRGYL